MRDVKASNLEVSIVMPAYNEASTISTSLQRVYDMATAEFDRFEIILVSDGSLDGTVEIAQAAIPADLRIIRLPVNVGKGRALARGIAESRFEIVALCDADLDLHPQALTPMVHAIHSQLADVAIGSKRHPDSDVRYPIWRRAQSRAFQTVCKILFSLDVSDTQTGQKVSRTDLLQTALLKTKSSGFAFDLEVLVILKRMGCRIQEFPVKLTYGYSSSISLRAVAQIVIETLRIWRRQYTDSDKECV